MWVVEQQRTTKHKMYICASQMNRKKGVHLICATNDKSWLESNVSVVLVFSLFLSLSLVLSASALNIVHIRTSSEFIRIIHMNNNRWYATTKVLNVFNTHHSSNYHICTFTIAFTIRQRENVFWNIFTSSRSLFECVYIYYMHSLWVDIWAI